MGKLGIMARAGVVLGSVSVLAVAVTFALSSTATLTDNTISSATAGLLVDGDQNNIFATSETGYEFENLIPGAGYDPATEQTFSLKNDGSSDLKVTVYATVGILDGVLDKSKVHVQFTNTTTTDPPVEYTLAQLEALFNDLPGVTGTGFLDKETAAAADDGEENDFTINVKMDETATTAGATLSDFDLVFTGTAVVPTPPLAP